MAAHAKKMLNISPAEFDPSRLVISNPVQTKTTVPYTRADISYLDDAGTPCRLCIQAPTQHSFGVGPVHAFDDKERTGPVVDYQVVYSMNSLATFESPTGEEEAFKTAMDSLTDTLTEKLTDESFFEMIPAAQAALLDPSSSRTKNGRAGIKPIYDFPRKDGDKGGKKIKIADTSKPARMYVKLIYFSGTDKSGAPYSRMETRFYRPPDTTHSLDPREFVNVRGAITPLFHIREVYFGNHGANPYGASFSIRLLEADFAPQEAIGSSRLLRGVPMEAEGIGADLPSAADFPKLGLRHAPTGDAGAGGESAPPPAAGAGGESIPKPKKKKKKPVASAAEEPVDE